MTLYYIPLTATNAANTGALNAFLIPWHSNHSHS